MTAGFAIPTGAQYREDEATIVLTFDVLITNESLEYGSTYFGSTVAVEPGDTPEELRMKVTEQILTDAMTVTNLELQSEALTIPAYFKGIVGPNYEYPEPQSEEPPAEEPPAEEPPVEEPPVEEPPAEDPNSP